MKKLMNLQAILFLVFVLLNTSCSKETSLPNAITAETNFTVSNTIQTGADAILTTGGIEIPIESLLGLEEGSMIDSATINTNETELVGFLSLWNIDLNGKSITFTNIATEELYPGYFRVLESETYERYYFTFDTPLVVENISTNNEFVTAEVISDTEIVIILGEGYDNTGSGFTVNFNTEE